MQDHQLALKPGYVLEGFRIERVLGKGGFGITYLAVDVRLGKKVAIKELLPDSIATRVEGSTVLPQSSSQKEDWEWAKERFVEEARMLAGFSHPAIVGVHLLIEANGTAYMVMDYIDGENYEAKLKRIGTEADEAALMAVIGPVLEGLEQVHQRGLLHRDIKPDNILIKQDGQPVLIDFGAARESVGKTVTMTSIVTHGYSPIEQYQSKGKMGPWTDIYAVGAVICRAITGEKPPLSTDRVMEDEFLWLSHRGLNGFSERFLNAADWALRVRAEERPQTVNEWKAVLGLASELSPATSNSGQWASQPQHSHKPRSATASSSAPPKSGRGKKPVGKRTVVLVVAGALGLIAAGFGISHLLKGGVEKPQVKQDATKVNEPVAAPTQALAQAEPTPTPEPSPVAPAEPAPPLYTKLVALPAGTLPDESFLRGTQVAAFAISPHEVTLGEWNALLPFAAERGYDLDVEDENSFHPPPSSSRDNHGTDPELPVSYVSWFDAVKWCNAKSEQDGLKPAYYVGSEIYRSGQKNPVLDPDADGYRLPTSAEWEWAAQGGDKTRGYRYSGSDEIDDVAWVRTNSEGRPHSVGTKKANEAGLYDMSGNLMEWCAEADPNSLRARFRGGWYYGAPDVCGVRIQGQGGSDGRDGMLGFRVASNFAPSADRGRAAYDEAMTLDWSTNAENEAKAIKLIRQSAEQGYAPAQFLIGQDYGSEENHDEAVEWYRKAAAQEYGPAQMVLGLSYLTGVGVEQNESEATRWFKAALPNCIRADDAFSMRFLGLAYKEGLGTEKDLIRAEKCLQEAADKGDTVAKDMLAELRSEVGDAASSAQAQITFIPEQFRGVWTDDPQGEHDGTGRYTTSITEESVETHSTSLRVKSAVLNSPVSLSLLLIGDVRGHPLDLTEEWTLADGGKSLKRVHPNGYEEILYRGL